MLRNLTQSTDFHDEADYRGDLARRLQPRPCDGKRGRFATW
jgi:hypothetical protein